MLLQLATEFLFHIVIKKLQLIYIIFFKIVDILVAHFIYCNMELYFRYSAHTYNFFICPQSFGPINPRFSCQVGVILMMAKNKHFVMNTLQCNYKLSNKPPSTYSANKFYPGELYWEGGNFKTGYLINLIRLTWQKC